MYQMNNMHHALQHRRNTAGGHRHPEGHPGVPRKLKKVHHKFANSSFSMISYKQGTIQMAKVRHNEQTKYENTQ